MKSWLRGLWAEPGEPELLTAVQDEYWGGGLGYRWEGQRESKSGPEIELKR